MSDFVHYDLGQLRGGQIVEIDLAGRANVLLMDSVNFQSYRSGRQHRYYGGEQVQSPAQVAVPHDGHWHLALDLGGATGQIQSAVRVVG